MPPMLAQREIAKVVSGRSGKIDETRKKLEEEIMGVHEYRTRLISDVVTGKLDVRGVELPAVEEYVDAGIEEAGDYAEDDLDSEDVFEGNDQEVAE